MRYLRFRGWVHVAISDRGVRLPLPVLALYEWSPLGRTIGLSIGPTRRSCALGDLVPPMFFFRDPDGNRFRMVERD